MRWWLPESRLLKKRAHMQEVPVYLFVCAFVCCDATLPKSGLLFDFQAAWASCLATRSRKSRLSCSWAEAKRIAVGSLLTARSTT